MKIAITGEQGFLGYHLTQYLSFHKGYEVVSLGKYYQDNISLLKNCDWLIHAAGVNRSEKVGVKNINITQELINLLENNNIKINISFISSIQEDYNNDYGNSKLKCKNILKTYCSKYKVKFISHKLPNLFGPFGKPNYNSVVATFCYNIIKGYDSNISDDTIKLCYVYDAIKSISKFKNENKYLEYKININDLYDTIKIFHKKYSLGVIPKLHTDFEINLFNTYRSYAPCKHKLNRNTDNRGYLIELVKSETNSSQVFFSTSNPGIIRGNHFHFGKIERFCILKGKAKVSMRKIGTPEITSYIVNEEDDTVIDMPILYTHKLTNIGNSELVCVFWVNEIFNKSKPDTYFVNV